nr:hypothetical protein [Tanacetum cinerariifolium]
MSNHVNNCEKANKEHNYKSVTAKLERYKERLKTFEQRLNIDLISREKMADSQMDDMIKEKLAPKEQVDSLEQNLSNQINEKECLLQTFTVFKSESKEKEDKYTENKIDLEKKIKELDNFIFKVGQSAHTVHMLTKPQAFYDNIHKQALGYQNPFYLKKDQRIKPTLYDSIVISNKHVSMPVIGDEETLILEQEFPKVSLVNESLKKLKLHLANFDKVVKIRTIPDARTKDIVMSDSEDSMVTYTSISNDYEESSDHPPSPDYVPGPEHPPLLVYVPYVLEPAYPKYMPPEDDILLAEEQPLPAAASPTADSPGYILESDSEEDDEDPEEDPADCHTDREDDDEEESSGDDADDENEGEDGDEDEEHLAPTDSVLPPVYRTTARMSSMTMMRDAAPSTYILSTSIKDTTIRDTTIRVDAPESMDASNTARAEVMSLRTTVLAQQIEITGLRAADRT